MIEVKKYFLDRFVEQSVTCCFGFSLLAGTYFLKTIGSPGVAERFVATGSGGRLLINIGDGVLCEVRFGMGPT